MPRRSELIDGSLLERVGLGFAEGAKREVQPGEGLVVWMAGEDSRVPGDAASVNT